MDHMFKDISWLLYTAIRNSFSFLWASTISVSIFFHMRPSESLLTHIIASKARIWYCINLDVSRINFPDLNKTSLLAVLEFANTHA